LNAIRANLRTRLSIGRSMSADLLYGLNQIRLFHLYDLSNGSYGSRGCAVGAKPFGQFRSPRGRVVRRRDSRTSRTGINPGIQKVGLPIANWEGTSNFCEKPRAPEYKSAVRKAKRGNRRIAINRTQGLSRSFAPLFRGSNETQPVCHPQGTHNGSISAVHIGRSIKIDGPVP